MDEPLSNLDAKLRGHMRAELKRLQADLGITTIYVTHDQIEAMTLAHRVAIMNRGVVQQIATPRADLRRPRQPVRRRLHRLAADEPAAGRAGRGQFRLPDGRFAHRPAPRAARKVTAGLRPEDCRVTGPAEGKIAARVYAIELIGDHTLITCQFGERHADGQGRQVGALRDGRGDRHRFRRHGGVPVRFGDGGAHSRAGARDGRGCRLVIERQRCPSSACRHLLPV